MMLLAIWAQGATKRIPQNFILGVVALVLVSCAAPGGVYKGYEGPDRDLKDIAVLSWSSPRVSHIDGDLVNEGWPLFGGRTVAHLSPGRHEITIHHDWRDLYSRDRSARTVDLTAALQPGHSYEVRDDPCKSCATFKVDFQIVDTGTADVIAGTTRYGFGPYGTAEEKEEQERKKVTECKDKCWDKLGECRYNRWKKDKDDDKCFEDLSDCTFYCDPIGSFFLF